MPDYRDFDGFSNIEGLLTRAMKMDRRAAEYIWRDIAKGETAFLEDPRWIAHVAKRVVRDLIDANPDSKVRAQLALQALGLAGTHDHDEKLYRELVASQTIRNWGDPADELGNATGKNLTRTEIAEQFIKTGLLQETSNLRAAAKRLDRVEKKLQHRSD